MMDSARYSISHTCPITKPAATPINGHNLTPVLAKILTDKNTQTSPPTVRNSNRRPWKAMEDNRIHSDNPEAATKKTHNIIGLLLFREVFI